MTTRIGDTNERETTMKASTKPSTNGSAHKRNGHATPSQLAGFLVPLETVPHGDTGEGETAQKNEARSPDGRTAQGTFAPGNKCARGNPTARKMAALRSALLDNLTADKMALLSDKLFAAALSGDWIAAKLLLMYAIGKAPEAVNPDRLDLDELHAMMERPFKTQLALQVLEGVDPAAAIEFLDEVTRASVRATAPEPAKILDQSASALRRLQTVSQKAMEARARKT